MAPRASSRRSFLLSHSVDVAKLQNKEQNRQRHRVREVVMRMRDSHKDADDACREKGIPESEASVKTSSLCQADKRRGRRRVYVVVATPVAKRHQAEHTC